MINVFKLEMLTQKRKVLITTLIILSILLLMFAIFPYMKTDEMILLSELELSSFPSELLNVMGIADIPNFSDMNDFFGYIFQYIALAMVIIYMEWAINLFVKEENNGTIDYILSKPISRNNLFFGKLISLASLITLSVFATGFVSLLSYMCLSGYDFSYCLKHLAVVFSSLLFVSFIYVSIGVYISSMFKKNKSATSISLLIVFGSYLVGVVSILVSNLSFLKWVSFMEWIKISKIMSEGITVPEICLGSIIIVAFICGAKKLYVTKEFIS